MAQINITRTHTFAPDAARAAADTALTNLKPYGITGTWAGNVCNLSGRGVTGRVELKDNTLSIEASLPLMLRPMTGAITREIESRLDAALSSSGAAARPSA